VDCNRGAVTAASLANGGYCPTTGNKVCGNNVTRMSKEHSITPLYTSARSEIVAYLWFEQIKGECERI